MRLFRILPLLCVLLGLASPGILVQTAAGAEASENPAEQYFTNVKLLNQNGEPMRLYQDLLKGKVVVIDTIFTECTGICPVMSKTFQKIQEHVGDRLGRDVHLISISVDPTNDTPEKLKEFAEKFDAKPGWYFLTGPKQNVDFALQKLGGYVEDRENHSALVIIGNEPTGLWKKAMGLAPAAKILPIVDSVLNDEGPESEASPAGGSASGSRAGGG
jgi:protein SCO1/2